MGVTSSDIELIKLALHHKPDIKSVMEMGSQNAYLPDTDPNKPPFASEWYRARGIEYSCIDMAGDNGAFVADLSKPLVIINKEGSAIEPTEDPSHGGEEIKFDLVTDFGTSEHLVAGVEMKNHFFENVNINSVYPVRVPTLEEIKLGYYNCWKNKHDLLKLGGIMISVNPKTGNWPDHGYTYINKDFYSTLAAAMGYEIYWLNENPAMGNPNAVNIECVLRKNIDNEFMLFEDFQLIEKFFK